MPTTRILIVREGDFFIHVQQLAEWLLRKGLEVEVLQSANGEPEPLYRDLIEATQRLSIPCHLVQDRASWVERRLVALAFRLRGVTKLGVITPYKIRAARRALAGRGPFDVVIAYDPPSLFLACQLFPKDYNKIVDYSLEVSDESHRDFQTSRTNRSFRYFERAVLPQLGALMIQDRFRAQVLLRHVPNTERVRTIFFPVAVNGAAVPSNSRSRPRYGLPPRGTVDARVLFFGGLWSEKLLRELEAVSHRLRDDQTLVIQGGRGTVKAPLADTGKLLISTRPVPFNQVNDVIASADIGLAIYPDDEANSRYTAFSSEKVARYLQCGLPFIAFHNEDYAYLQSETGCCELVRSYGEIPQAINTILDNYDRYHRGAGAAFETFFNRDRSGLELLHYIEAAA